MSLKNHSALGSVCLDFFNGPKNNSTITQSFLSVKEEINHHNSLIRRQISSLSPRLSWQSLPTATGSLHEEILLIQRCWFSSSVKKVFLMNYKFCLATRVISFHVKMKFHGSHKSNSGWGSFFCTKSKVK